MITLKVGKGMDSKNYYGEIFRTCRAVEAVSHPMNLMRIILEMIFLATTQVFFNHFAVKL